MEHKNPSDAEYTLLLTVRLLSTDALCCTHHLPTGGPALHLFLVDKSVRTLKKGISYIYTNEYTVQIVHYTVIYLQFCDMFHLQLNGQPFALHMRVGKFI